jgi:hypothetical protein
MRCTTSISTVLNPIPPAANLETGRDLAGQADAAINLPQAQRACVRRDGAAVESSCGVLATLSWRRGHPLLELKPLSQKNFR